ncbi:hypothetical protein GCM10025771_24030 [Niveibacterium umoris]
MGARIYFVAWREGAVTLEYAAQEANNASANKVSTAASWADRPVSLLARTTPSVKYSQIISVVH